MDRKGLMILGGMLIVVIGVFHSIKSNGITGNVVGIDNEVHEHADFMVYLNGDALNFAHEVYMVRDRKVHIEDMIGSEIHKHADEITLGYFFNSLGFEFNEECFIRLMLGIELWRNLQ